MKPSNFHTHTTYCHGKDTPRELVEEAIRLGCPKIGFSSHSYTETGDEQPYCMSLEGTERYKAEIRSLKEEFRGRIEIYLGIERDYFSMDPTADYDYAIGSVHYVKKDGVYLPVDESREKQMEAVEKHYGGDYYAMIEDYYRLVGDLDRRTNCDVIGHFDLITKYNENGELFDIRHPRYLAAARDALTRLMGKGLYLEINHGAVVRGLRKTPYPEASLLEAWQSKGEKTLCSSDCHDKNKLLFGIEGENDFSPRR